ncbi:glutamyl-tRNA reductase [Dongia mobilis]|uniref:Glutamyl-tRNA reductase n=1 Tax=Dongia mobilis TaxID=578943 RepID=A0A4R6WIY5_9PROT|nr:glutamyl-tRNA reductase [Dongia mobilis]TDQ78763.1 glutamyl-tRNA reductase [Dongia mobilis]
MPQHWRPVGDPLGIAPGTFLIVGAEHKRAPDLLREQLQGDDADALRLLLRCREKGLKQAMVLATCDRCEIWAVVDDETRAASDITALIAEAAGGEVADVAPKLHYLADRAALRYGFSVAASLESQVVGEPQVLGQVKEAYQFAARAGTMGTELERVLQAAFAAAKRVRSETDIAAQSVSMAACVVKIARQVHGSLDTLSALLLGVGDLGQLALEHLREAGLQRWAVIHGEPARAREIAQHIQGHVGAFAELPQALVDADVVVTALDAARYVVEAPAVATALRKRRHRPILLVDLAIPGDVDPKVDAVDDAFRYAFDDLERLARAGRKERSAAVQAATAIIDAELDRFEKARQVRDISASLTGLREYFEGERQALLSENPRLDAEELSRRLVNRLLHRPLNALRDNANDPELERAARRLFGLDRNKE